MTERPIILTIAGFDPSGCAGILADIKAMEAFGVHGMAVLTANTAQNDISFLAPNWINKQTMLEQLRLLLSNRQFSYAKIGIVENLETLQILITELKAHNANIRIIWDPVMKASAGFEFHNNVNREVLEAICKQLFLITPNTEELKLLAPNMDIDNAGKYLSTLCNILIKGGHSEGPQANDLLYSNGECHTFEAQRISGFGKRGTGCVLSASILAGLSKSDSLQTACFKAKEYIHKYIKSNETHIGFHFYQQ